MFCDSGQFWNTVAILHLKKQHWLHARIEELPLIARCCLEVD